MHARVDIAMDNAAFDGAAAGVELARILHVAARAAADVVDECSEGICKLRDINGNTVGKLTIYADED